MDQQPKTSLLNSAKNKQFDAVKKESLEVYEEEEEEEGVDDEAQADGGGDNDDVNGNYWDEDGYRMPLLQYSRVTGSLPRAKPNNDNNTNSNNSNKVNEGGTGPLSVVVTCSSIGKVMLEPPPLYSGSDGGGVGGGVVGAATAAMAMDVSPSNNLNNNNSNKANTGNNNNKNNNILGNFNNNNDSNDDDDDDDDENNMDNVGGINKNAPFYNPTMSDLVWNQPHQILAMGLDSGQVALITVSCSPGETIIPRSQLTVRDTNNTNILLGSSSPSKPPPVVDVSLDASGTILTAVDAGGMCTVWELKYTATATTKKTNNNDGSASPATSSTNAAVSVNNSSSSAATTTTRTTTSASSPAPSQPGGGNDMFSSFMSAITGMSNPTATVAAATVPAATTTSTNTTTTTSSSSAANKKNNNEATVIALTATIVQVSRSTYPLSFGMPTCVLVDPAYKKKREKAILVGFADGRLVLTKRGFFQRRNDVVLYQGVGTTETATKAYNNNTPPNKKVTSYRGIQEIAWRGSLVAWADSSGMKLLDIETLSRIAHIDRPTGARPSLYPTITSFRPCLIFETSNQLLVGWGDCLMTLTVRETKPTPAPNANSNSTNPFDSGSNNNSSNESNSALTADAAKRRTVECTMAWELDCVACGVTPLDERHVMVLGLVPPSDDDEDDIDNNDNNNDVLLNGNDTIASTSGGNDLEIQILSRLDGTVVYCDSLPLWPLSSSVPGSKMAVATVKRIEAAASSIQLLSSFALPRMDDVTEAQEEKLVSGDVSDELDLNLFATAMTAGMLGQGPMYKDVHLRWDFDTVISMEAATKPVTKTAMYLEGEDQDSVDSDDYDFVLDPFQSKEFMETMSKSNKDGNIPPPVIVVVSSSDIIRARVADIDDAISHAMAIHKAGIALRLAVRHKRQLRRFELPDLVDRYLGAVLRRKRVGFDNDEDDDDNDDDNKNYGSSSSLKQQNGNVSQLSIRRMKLAANALPVLLGGDLPAWERWTKEFSNIPGALFVLRDRLPVRDPILPSSLYEMVLEKMLLEVEQIIGSAATTAGQSNSGSSTTDTADLALEAEGHFISSLIAWGPTKIIKDHIKLYKSLSVKEKDGSGRYVGNPALKSTEIALQRRYMQTAAGYLHFPVHPTALAQNNNNSNTNRTSRLDAMADSLQDSLYDVTNLVNLIAPRVPLVAVTDNNESVASLESVSEHHKTTLTSPNSRMALDAMARVQMMQGNYDVALRCFLAIGAFHSPLSLESVEAEAIAFVHGKTNESNNTNKTTNKDNNNDPLMIGSTCYDFVMGIIEYHHLHQMLLNTEFVLSTDSKLFLPLFALLRLVGTEIVGKFLIDHCTSPQLILSREEETDDTNNNNNNSIKGEGRESLPIDEVAEQLERSPALLHWYLHLVYTQKPEIYVKFPTTANPPKVVTDLHRKHLDLYIRYAGSERDSALSITGTEKYKVERKSTQLLQFLKDALVLGGIRPLEARRLLEAEREPNDEEDDDEFSPVFALELAYVLEHYGYGTEDEAKGILDLYMLGAHSVTLAVAFAQRQKKYSPMLWERLIGSCLANEKITTTTSTQQKQEHGGGGMLFGSLLEAAALAGADLARLVTEIPPGMAIEGLRPRLVAAVADYRLKLQIHEAATAAANEEKVTLLREINHRSRRGVRYDYTPLRKHVELAKTLSAMQIASGTQIMQSNESTLAMLKSRKPKERRDRYNLAYKVPML